ncbi:MAG: tyrosine-type recombinase/integrase [Solirubrobacteraceae bacterium]
MTPKNREPAADRRGPEAVGSIVKRYRKRDRQHTYGLRIRAYGERYWVPLGTEREGWNDVRAADRRDEIAGLVQRKVWRPPNTFELDPREKKPGFHEFTSDWLKRYRRTVDASTADTAEYMLSHHLLPFLHTYRLDEIDYAVLSTYLAHKLERNEEVEVAQQAGVILRNGRGQPRRPLSPRTINMTLDLIARIFKDAVKRGLLQSNPASDRELRLKVTQRKRNFLEADELLALIDAAGAIDEPVSKETLARAELTRRMRRDSRTWKEIAAELGVAESTAIWLAGRYRKAGHTSARRAILATLGCAGLRNSEVCELDLGDLDFAHGMIHVRDAKTEAGVRQVSMTPWLHDELLAYRATRADAQLEEPAFPTRSGARRDRRNINRLVIAPAARAANALRAERRNPPLPASITAHTFRRTFITLMLEAGAPVPYVQAQVGHEDPTTTLAIYAQVLKRRDRRRHGESFDALMADAVPSAASIIMPGKPRLEGRDTRDMSTLSVGSGHRNELHPNL